MPQGRSIPPPTNGEPAAGTPSGPMRVTEASPGAMTFASNSNTMVRPSSPGPHGRGMMPEFATQTLPRRSVAAPLRAAQNERLDRLASPGCRGDCTTGVTVAVRAEGEVGDLGRVTTPGRACG